MLFVAVHSQKLRVQLTSSHLSVDDEDQSSGSFEDHLAVKRGVKEVHLARKVPDLEVDEGGAGDVVLVDFVGALEKERLIWGHLMENHLLRQTNVEVYTFC